MMNHDELESGPLPVSIFLFLCYMFYLLNDTKQGLEA